MKSSIVEASSMEFFFHGCISDTVSTRKIKVCEETIVYLTHLLAQFSRSQRFFSNDKNGIGLQPLALLYTSALASQNDTEKKELLKRLGDLALFVSGWFAQGLERKNISLDYYIEMGELAYQWLGEAHDVSSRNRALAETFSDLSQYFSEFVDVLNEIHLTMEGSSNEDLLRIYELWLRTGSKKVAELLRTRGIEVNHGMISQTRH